jgi:hypothetical protein
VLAAVTRKRMVAPASSAWTTYVPEVAPLTAEHEAPALSQRSQA